jgi:hypothetical protein
VRRRVHLTLLCLEQVREELESMGCQIKTGREVKSVLKSNEGISEA